MAQDTRDEARRAEQLIAEDGATFAEQAGIKLRDTPAPLYQLSVLTMLLSTRISAPIAVAAARELFAAGWRTPKAMAGSTWQQRVDALGRAHYKRYDESTSTALAEGVELIQRRWHGDLRKLREEAGRDPKRIRELLQEVPRIGPLGAEIFCREAQGLWPELRPSFDRRALDGARAAGLATDPAELAELVPAAQLPKLAAALVRTAAAERHDKRGDERKAGAARSGAKKQGSSGGKKRAGRSASARA